MPTTTLTDTELNSLALDGHIWRQGSLYADSAHPPLLAQRAQMLSARLPQWAIVAGHSAGWVWTGLGRPEPWSVICPTRPALSPIARTTWKPRARRIENLDTTQVGQLKLLSRSATAKDLLSCPGDDDVAAAQLYQLSEPASLDELVAVLPTIQQGPIRERMRRRVHRVRQWWRDYPVVTR